MSKAREAFEVARTDGHLWEFDSFCAGFDRGYAAALAAQCQVEWYSSRACERGTKGCEVVHAATLAAPAREPAAKICDDLAAGYDRMAKSKMVTEDGRLLHEGMWAGATNCAASIRALAPSSPPRAPDSVRALVDRQAEDEGLWFNAQTAAEAYLQQELRRLHAAVEASPPRAPEAPDLPPTVESLRIAPDLPLLPPELWSVRHKAEAIRDYARAAVAASLAAPAGEPQWQPIATAPKGRKLLLGYPNKLGNWRTIVGRYYLPGTLELENDTLTDDGFAEQGWYEETESHETINPTDGEPTHWMPLPAAPGAAPQEPQAGEAHREIEELVRRYRIEDTDLHRELHRLLRSTPAPQEPQAGEAQWLAEAERQITDLVTAARMGLAITSTVQRSLITHLRTRPSQEPRDEREADDESNFPFYELRFIMRVLGHEGRAPEEDWKTALGMAREIFKRWHAQKVVERKPFGVEHDPEDSRS